MHSSLPRDEIGVARIIILPLSSISAHDSERKPETCRALDESPLPPPLRPPRGLATLGNHDNIEERSTHLDNLKEALAVVIVDESVIEHTVHLVYPKSDKLARVSGVYARKQKNSLKTNRFRSQVKEQVDIFINTKTFGFRLLQALIG